MLACVVVPEAVEILNYVVCVGKHVIVTIEQETSMQTASFHPFEKERLLQSEVEKRLIEVPLEDVVVLPMLECKDLVILLSLKTST